jgi:ferredoxin
VRVVVDRDLCVSSGTCTQIAPEVFELRDGTLHVLLEEPPEELRTGVVEAEELCPTAAITIEG